MRITFMGSTIPPTRRAQQMMSIFVEVGWDPARRRAKDQFVFDCGAGVVANYGAMDVGFGRMDKIFITHLHGDHVSDMTHIYCFGLRVGPALATVCLGTRPVRRPEPEAAASALRRRHEGLLQPSARGAAVAHRKLQLPADQLLGALPHAGPGQGPVGPAGPACCRVGRSLGRCLCAGPDRARLEQGGRRRLRQQGNGRADHALSGDPLPQGVDRLQARMERPVDDLLGRHQARKDQHRAGEERRSRRDCLRPRDGGPRRDLGDAGTASSEAAAARSQPALGRLRGPGDRGAGQLTHATGRIRVPAEPGRSASAAHGGHALPRIGRHGRLRDAERPQSRSGHRQPRRTAHVLVRWHGDQRLRRQPQGDAEAGRGAGLRILPVPQIYGAYSVPKYHFENGLPDPYAQIDRTQEIQAGEQTYCRSGY